MSKFPQIDWKHVREMSGGDADFEKEILADYLADAETLVAQIHMLIECSDLPNVAKIAHTLKGSSKTVGAVAMAEAAAGLEAAAKVPDMAPAQNAHAELREVFESFSRFFEAWVADSAA
jgi:HPt (histidine-containing phosphotransfer) domain-containing protein